MEDFLSITSTHRKTLSEQTEKIEEPQQREQHTEERNLVSGSMLCDGNHFRDSIYLVNVGSIMQQPVAVFGLRTFLGKRIYPVVDLYETVVVKGRRVVPLRAALMNIDAIILLQCLIERVVQEPFRKYRAWRPTARGTHEQHQSKDKPWQD